MMSSVIFIGSPEKVNGKKLPLRERVQNLLAVPPKQLAFRVIASFVPPFGNTFRKVYVDFLGPLLALVLLSQILEFGYSLKSNKVSLGPKTFLFCYGTLMPLICYALAAIGRSDITLWEIFSLLGYALYGHIFTLAFSYMCFQETSNAFFFFCVIIFAGLSTFRLVVVLLKTIPLPGPRLLICSVIAITQIISLIVMHFGYVHRTFVYGQKQ